MKLILVASCAGGLVFMLRFLAALLKEGKSLSQPVTLFRATESLKEWGFEIDEFEELPIQFWSERWQSGVSFPSHGSTDDPAAYSANS
jgi:hypothetical protein